MIKSTGLSTSSMDDLVTKSKVLPDGLECIQEEVSIDGEE